MFKVFCDRARLLTMLALVIAYPMRSDRQVPASTQLVTGRASYVSPDGNDLNPGTLSSPWRTINKATRVVQPGDTVYVRRGIYREKVTIGTSGTQTQPIRFLAYRGEIPIIDGENSIPQLPGGALLSLSGNYVTVSGFVVRRSTYMCVILKGSHTRASGIRARDCPANGILITGDYGIVENSEVTNAAFRHSPGWGSALSAARHPQHAIIRRNYVHDNYGEGISTFEADGTIIEDNVIRDSWSANLYISDATNVTVRRNLIYTTANSLAMSDGSRVGIMLGDEKYSPPSSGITIVNNLVYQTYHNFWWWQGLQGGGMVNVLVAHNTFVNSREGTNLLISQGDHQNVRIAANVFEQDDSLPVAQVISNPELHFSSNLWSKSPPSAASAANDVIGNPQLARAGQAVTSDWFKLRSTSPARNRGMVLPEVTQDFFGIARGTSPDIGAIEFRARPAAAPKLLEPTSGAVSTELHPLFDWIDMTEATGYNIQIARSGIMYPLALNSQVTASSFVPLSTLPRGFFLYWRVRASYPTGWGPWSETRSLLISP